MAKRYVLGAIRKWPAAQIKFQGQSVGFARRVTLKSRHLASANIADSLQLARLEAVGFEGKGRMFQVGGHTRSVEPTPFHDLRARGIDEAQAAELRARLKTFAEDWERPEASIYDQDPAR